MTTYKKNDKNIKNRMIGRFCRDTTGTTMMVFGLMFMVMALSIGAGMDYARVMSVQSALQRDLDAAILAGATQSGGELSAEQIADNYFGSNWRDTHKSGEVTVDLSDGDDAISATAEAPVPMTIMKLAGFNEGIAKATSKVKFGGADVEIALVLDTTGSMEGQKLVDLKAAADRLIDTVFEVQGSEQHVKVGIVPFSQYVNVGLGRRNASWIDVPPDTQTTENQCSMVQPVTGQSNCRMETYNYTQDGTPMSYQYETCDYQYGSEVEQCQDVTVGDKWNGCVGSRNFPLNAQDDQYSTRIPGIMNTWCSAELTPLSNDKYKLKEHISWMSAAHETYIPAGLMWGWRVLSNKEPLDEGAPDAQMANGKVKKILVLMTDGENTKSKSGGAPTHDGGSKADADALTLELCEKIKNEGIKVFTVAFDVTATSVLDDMKTCASDLSSFFETGTGAQLKTAFQKIGKSTRGVSLAE